MKCLLFLLLIVLTNAKNAEFITLFLLWLIAPQLHHKLEVLSLNVP